MPRILLFRNITRAYFLLFLFLAIVSTNYGQQTTGTNDFFTPQNRLRFGNYLFNEKDYLRALDEYREYLKTDDSDTIRFKYADCFFMIRRYEDASDNFKSLFYHSSLSDQARLGFYKSVFHQNDYNKFRDLVDQENYLPDNFRKDIIRLKFISHLLDNSYLPESNEFLAAFDDSNKVQIQKFYYMKKFPAKKSPVTAALLSTAIPGLGKIYTGEVSDGITAFITTGLLTFLSINNFNHNHKFRGWLFAGLSALSYGGNIYGSAASAQIYNAGVKLSFDKEVKIYFENRNYLLPKDEYIE